MLPRCARLRRSSPRSVTCADAAPCSPSSWSSPAPPSRTLRWPGKIGAGCHQPGVVILTCGTYGNVLRFLPPLVIAERLLDEALDVLERGVHHRGLTRQGAPNGGVKSTGLPFLRPDRGVGALQLPRRRRGAVLSRPRAVPMGSRRR